jgi:hypothetical protein
MKTLIKNGRIATAIDDYLDGIFMDANLDCRL